jgi:hypothetical protein
MSNADQRQTHEHEVRQEFYNESNGDTYTNVTRTTETVNNNTSNQKTNSYRDGYVHGRVSERRYQENVLVERDNENAARGLLIGILLTSLAALAAGVIWLLNQSNEAPTSVIPPVVVPDSQPDKNQPPQKETIIERTRDVLVPVPQPQAPSPAPQQDLNITVPNSAPQQPAAEQAPATQTAPTQPQNQSSKTGPQVTQSDTSSTTPTQTPSNQTDTTSDSSSASTETSGTSSPAQ